MPEGMPPVWNSYIAVDDPAAATEAATAAGGTVMMPAMEIMNDPSDATRTGSAPSIE